jgi:hypothetical protein
MAYLVIIRQHTPFLIEAIPVFRCALSALATANDAFGLALDLES